MVVRKRGWGATFGNAARIGIGAYNTARRFTVTNKRQRGNGSRSMTRQKRNGSSGVGVTTQHDARLVYRKKSMPKRKRKVWKKFIRKVEAVALAKQGTTSVVYNVGRTVSSAADAQDMYGIVLYGAYGSQTAGLTYYSDLELLGSINRTAGVGVNLGNRKLYFRSAVLDLTCANSGVNAVELDFYDIIFKKTPVQMTSLQDLIDTNQGNNTEVFEQGAVAANNLTRQTLGATPFQFPGVLSFVTILKKSKVFLPVGALSTYQIRLPRNRWFDTSNRAQDASTNAFALRGWTRGIWVVQKGTPTTLVRSAATSVSWSITRTYTMKTVDEDQVDLSGVSNF